jgi:type I restriction enzyme, S subunit
MSRIGDLIKELAPMGVQFKTLGDVGEIFRGKRFTKADYVDEGGVGCIHYGEIYTDYGTAAAKTVARVRPDLAPSLRFARKGDVVLTDVGETVEDVGKAVAWLGDEDVAIHDHCYVIRSSVNPVYLSYYMQTAAFRSDKNRYVARTKVKTLLLDGLKRIVIPVPPVEVQREIVRVLDLFSGLEADLATQLGAEQEARRHQYQQHRRTILEGRTDGAQDVRLGDIADILVGFPFKSSDFTDDQTETSLVRGDNIGQGFFNDRKIKRWRRAAGDSLETYELRAGDIVLAMDRPWISAGLKWARITEEVLPALLVQRVARLRSDANVLDQRFLGCTISSPAFTAYVLQSQTGNTVPHISGAQIKAFQFSLPALPEQIRMAAALEDLDALTGNLMIDLTTERNARRKQYEYYRDRLLTFKELAA